jgi:hypothetical protein
LEEQTTIGQELNDVCAELACIDHLYYVWHPLHYKCSEHWIVNPASTMQCEQMAVIRVAVPPTPPSLCHS